MTIKDFVKGKKPDCPIPPNFKHTPIRVMGSEAKCVWCGSPLDKQGK